MPKVSVIIPNYNHERFLRQRFDSVLQQTYADWELIYLDDASRDGSNAIADEYSAKHGVRMLLNTENSGSPFKQWNKGIDICAGEYIWIAEADDYADPRLLERLVGFLEADPQVGIAYAQSYSVDAEGNKLCTCDKLYEALPGKPFEVDFVADGKDLLKRLMFRLNIIPNASAVLFRKSVYLQAGGGVTGMRICGDWVTWARMMNLGKVAFVAEPLSYFRWHSGSVRAKMGFSKISITESYQAHAEVLRLVEVDAAVREEVATYCAMSWLDRNAGENLTLAEHLEIFRIARQIDTRVTVRIFRKLCRWALSHLGLNSFVSTLAQRSAVERAEQSLS